MNSLQITDIFVEKYLILFASNFDMIYRPRYVCTHNYKVLCINIFLVLPKIACWIFPIISFSFDGDI